MCVLVFLHPIFNLLLHDLVNVCLLNTYMSSICQKTKLPIHSFLGNNWSLTL